MSPQERDLLIALLESLGGEVRKGILVCAVCLSPVPPGCTSALEYVHAPQCQLYTALKALQRP